MSPATTEDTAVFSEQDLFEEVDLTSQWSQVTLLSDGGWVSDALRAIAGLSYLCDDWDSYGSPPPTRAAMKEAVSMLAKVDGDMERYLSGPRVMPTSGGGVALDWSGSVRELEVEFLPDGSPEYLTSVHGEPVSEGAIQSVEDFRQRLLWLLEG